MIEINIKHISTDDLKQMTGTEALILQGCGGDPKEWVDGINDLLTEQGILRDGDVFRDISVFDNDGITCLMFGMDNVNLDIGKLAIWRLQSHANFGGTWLSDFIQNRLGINTEYHESGRELDHKDPDLEAYEPKIGAVSEDTPPIAALSEQSIFSNDGSNNESESYHEDHNGNFPPSKGVLTDIARDKGPLPPLRVYIENIRDETIGGFTIPLPTTAEKLRPWLEGIEAKGPQDIVIREIESPISGLTAVLPENPLLNELNYLATKINELGAYDRDTFSAVIEAGWHCDSVADLINLTDNIPLFDLQPAFSEEQYGEFLLETRKDATAEAFMRLEKSDNPKDRELAAHILLMESYVNCVAYGRDAIDEESGVITEHGYITGGGEFQEIYRGPDDVPLEYRVLPYLDPPFFVEDVNLVPFLIKLHAVTGFPAHDTEYNLGVLTGLRSAEYLLLIDKGNITLTEAAHAYRVGTTAYDAWVNASDGPDTKTFAIHVTEVHGRLAGDVVTIDFAERQCEILQNSIEPYQINATLENGEIIEYTPQEWDAMSQLDRDRVQSYVRKFTSEDLSAVNRHLEDITLYHREFNCPIGEDAFLVLMNAVYMNQAQAPQDDMLRLSQGAAKEILARGDADVYRLMPSGPVKLNPLDAVKSAGLNYSEYREFAIKLQEIDGLDKWANRAAFDMLRNIDRAERDKSKSRGEEL